jgi:S-adenosylmethionine decarboxylase
MGKHYILNLYGCPFDLLDDLEFLVQLLKESALLCGATILRESSYKFEPQGVTAILLLAESHISIHTVPEKGEAYVDFYTCSVVDPIVGCENVAGKLRPETYKIELINR